MVTRTVSNKLARIIMSKVYLDIDPTISGTVLLAGVARSGSTWLSNVINADNHFRYLFEPFHGEVCAPAKMLKKRPYLRPDAENQKVWKLAESVFSGRIRDPWIDSCNTKLIAKKRLVKEVSCNLMLSWIARNFPDLKVVFLIRHPCAVAYSRMKLGWDSYCDEFLKQEDLMEDFLEPFRDLLSEKHDEFSRQIIMWCVEHYVPLKQLSQANIYTAFYENFCMDPKKEVRSLYRYLKLPYSSSILEKAKLPSSTSRTDSAVQNQTNLLEGWKKNLSTRQVERSRELVKAFELDYLYEDQPAPQTDSPFKK